MNAFGRLALPALLGLLAAPSVQFVLGVAAPLETAQADAAQTGSGTPVTLDRIMATVSTVRHVAARYVEHRYLHVLRTPIETRGWLRFDAPAHLEKATDPATDGAAEKLTIDGDRLTIARGNGAAPVVLSLHEHPEIGVLVESVRATLSGDSSALRRIFDVTPSGTLSHWQLVLQPRDPAQHAMLQWMRVSGYAERITTIETANGEGDRSEMAIVEQTP
jgi:Outer membrane lipoprotein carrier protein LolA-like